MTVLTEANTCLANGRMLRPQPDDAGVCDPPPVTPAVLALAVALK